ncbi:SDR family NAD(P)-dependent oxidoreductase [Streptomyces violaceus]
MPPWSSPTSGTPRGRTWRPSSAPPARYLHLDVTGEDAWQRALAETERDLGPVSVLVNIAGIIDWGTMEEQSPASFRRVVDVNLTGAWLGMRAAAPSLRRAGGGVIVPMSSLAGLTAYAGVGAYAASKWGLRGLTKVAALELAPDRVRVCSVHPGAIRTRMTAGFGDAYTAGQPVPRFGEPGRSPAWCSSSSPRRPSRRAASSSWTAASSPGHRPY